MMEEQECVECKKEFEGDGYVKTRDGRILMVRNGDPVGVLAIVKRGVAGWVCRNCVDKIRFVMRV